MLPYELLVYMVGIEELFFCSETFSNFKRNPGGLLRGENFPIDLSFLLPDELWNQK